MSSARLDIISIGTLSRNRLWNETEAKRTPHSTCSLIRTGKQTLLVDPGLPAQILVARLNERTGLSPGDIDAIFLTNFRPSHRAGVMAFEGTKLFIHENEQQAVRQYLKVRLEETEDDAERGVLRRELDLVELCTPAPDKLAENVDLFPLFGPTPGNCGLLITSPMTSILVTGDAVATQDHFLAGQVLPDCVDLEAAQESLKEVYEIADLIVPAHDNIFVNPRGQGM
jgi:glyoxylase-like metal-dependent hydrolase (beta-lactamase superfamily II)